MNGGSASASEIFAGGILGTGSGIVIGERSYGKGVAQIVYDGTNCPYLTDDAVKLTAYRFYCAGGNTSDRVGVVPTLYIPQGRTTAVAQLLAGEKRGGWQRVSAPCARTGLDFYVDVGRGERADRGDGSPAARARAGYGALLGRKRRGGARDERAGARKARRAAGMSLDF